MSYCVLLLLLHFDSYKFVFCFLINLNRHNVLWKKVQSDLIISALHLLLMCPYNNNNHFVKLRHCSPIVLKCFGTSRNILILHTQKYQKHLHKIRHQTATQWFSNLQGMKINTASLLYFQCSLSVWPLWGLLISFVVRLSLLQSETHTKSWSSLSCVQVALNRISIRWCFRVCQFQQGGIRCGLPG